MTDQWAIQLQARISALQAEVISKQAIIEGMKAENSIAFFLNNSLPYPMESFENIANEISGIANQLFQLGAG